MWRTVQRERKQSSSWRPPFPVRGHKPFPQSAEGREERKSYQSRMRPNWVIAIEEGFSAFPNTCRTVKVAGQSVQTRCRANHRGNSVRLVATAGERPQQG